MTEETQKIIEQVLEFLYSKNFARNLQDYPDTQLIDYKGLKKAIEKALELQQEVFGKSDFRDKIFSLADILEIIDKLPANVLNDYKKDILKEKINNLK